MDRQTGVAGAAEKSCVRLSVDYNSAYGADRGRNTTKLTRS
jgi:hypothetical protein